MEKKKTLASKTKKIKSTKRSPLALEVYDLKGKVCGLETLPKEIFAQSFPQQLLAQVVRVFLARARKGTLSTKTRAQVRGGGRKPWRQKGTGRARAGSIRAPQWKGGGVVFGPKPRDFALSLPKKMKRLALFGALSDKFKKKKIILVQGLDKLDGKTKSFGEFISQLPIANGRDKKILLILSKDDQQIKRAARNLPNVSLADVASLNTYQILNSDFLLFAKKALVSLNDLFMRSNKQGNNAN